MWLTNQISKSLKLMALALGIIATSTPASAQQNQTPAPASNPAVQSQPVAPPAPPLDAEQQALLLLRMQQQDQQLQMQPQWGFQNPTLPVSLPSADQLQSVAIDPKLKSYVLQLDDPSFQTREQATKLLLESAGDKLQLYAILCRERDLTIEQRYRLLGVLQDQLVRAPRGALGISSNQGFLQMQQQIQIQQNPNGQVQPNGQPQLVQPPVPPGPMGIRVDDLLPGMPAERVLRIGDRITHVDGQPLAVMTDLTIYVQTRKPGEKVKLTVRRTKVDNDGKVIQGPNNEPIVETVDVDLELGSADMLNKIRPGGSATSPVEINRAMEAAQALARYSPPSVPVPAQGGPIALLNATSRPLGQPAPAMPEFDPAIDRFPAVRDLIRDKQRIAQGVMVETRSLRDEWNRKYMEIIQNAQRPGMSSEKQSFMQSVLSRYQQLMNQ